MKKKTFVLFKHTVVYLILFFALHSAIIRLFPSLRVWISVIISIVLLVGLLVFIVSEFMSDKYKDEDRAKHWRNYQNDSDYYL